MTHNVNDYRVDETLELDVIYATGGKYLFAKDPDDAKHIWIVQLVKLDLTNDEDLALLRDIDPDWTSKMK